MNSEKMKSPSNGIRHASPMAREPRSQWVSMHHCDHLVQFYEDDGYLVDSVSVFLGSGFGAGDAAIVIATKAHRESLVKRMKELGMAVVPAIEARQLVLLDAADTLSEFMVDGWPDEALFNKVVGGHVAKALKAHLGLRAFGEMVALLWAQGSGPAAIRLEELWNNLGKTCSFSLFCAYPMSGFRGTEHSEAFAYICKEHNHVIPGESFNPRGDSDKVDLRSIALLQQKAISLEAEILERKSAEEASRRLAAIVESSFDAIISKDLNGIITSWNTGAEQIYGYKPEEAIGKPITLLIPPELMPEEPLMLERIRNGERIAPFETVRIRKDGSRIDISLTVSPIKDGSGKIIGAAKIARDITDKKRYEAALAEKEEQLRQGQKMEAVGRLAGGIAHDFNNLLTAINGYSEMALSMVAEGDLLQEFLQEIKKSGDRAASLTQQLLAYSRKQILAPTVFNLNSTVSEMDRMLRRLIGEDIEINTVLDPDLGLVKADTGQVQQIILNLVLNARDAMPTGGRLTIETANRVLDESYVASHLEATPGPHVMLAVGDSGSGMSEAVLLRIFEPFFTTKEVGKGTGLGLSCVFGILKQSGGSISVDSEPGRGSTFRVFLPIANPEAGTARAHPRTDSKVDGRRSETILLVEDEETVRKFVHRTLLDRGYTILDAKDGVEALALAKLAGPIDLLLTDVVMPNLNGGQLAETLKRFHPGLKVLFMSGYPDNVHIPSGYQDRTVRFLQKPFAQSNLLQLVRDLVDQGKQA